MREELWQDESGPSNMMKPSGNHCLRLPSMAHCSDVKNERASSHGQRAPAVR